MKSEKGFVCDKCGQRESRVVDCRKTKDGKRRIRACIFCGFRISTVEKKREKK